MVPEVYSMTIPVGSMPARDKASSKHDKGRGADEQAVDKKRDQELVIL